jgi:pilus assembly protein CpaB
VSPAPRRPGLMIAAGLGAGLVLSCLLAGIVGYPLSQKLMKEKRKGWELVPVVVAAVDMKAGDPVSMENISQRSIPEQFVTRSVVRPDSASYVVDRPLLVPLNAGDPIPWAAVEDDASAVACSRRVDELLRLRPVVSPALQRVGDELRDRARAGNPRPPP